MPEEQEDLKPIDPWGSGSLGGKDEGVDVEKEAEQAGLISKADKIAGAVPIGAVLPYFGGYFDNSRNKAFSMVMAEKNEIDAVNDLVSPDGYRVCDGSAYYDEDSPIFNKYKRYLPNLTDDIFLMGDTKVGNYGGENRNTHIHTAETESGHVHNVDPPDTSEESAHIHSINPPSRTSAAGTAHSHGTGSSKNTGNQSQNHTHGITGRSHDHPVDNTSHVHGGITSGGDNTESADGADSPTGLANGCDTPTQGISQSHTHGYTRCDQSESAHTHDVDIPAFDSAAGSAHKHTIAAFDSAAGSAHTHVIGEASDPENRPKFLSCFFIMRVK